MPINTRRTHARTHANTGGEDANGGGISADRARDFVVLLLGLLLRDGRAGGQRHRRGGLLGVRHLHPSVHNRGHPAVLYDLLHLLRQGPP